MRHFFSNKNIESTMIYQTTVHSTEYDLSIVIPTYNRIDLLRQTIKSILNQTPPNYIKYQLIIASNDPEFEYKSLDIDFTGIDVKIYCNRANLGMCGNMNRCAELATGKYITYIQDDDILLDSYLCTIEELIENRSMDNIDCLIPNRFFYFDNKEGFFGQKTKKKEQFKSFINHVIRIGCKTPTFQKVTAHDCYKYFFNCFAGGPTCGMIFNRSSLLATQGFDPNYPYAFDFVFFINFAENNNVVLYNKYLSIYRMTESASNKPHVQYDFYRSEMYMIDYLKSKNKNRYDSDLLKLFAYETKSKEAQKMIGKDYTIKYKHNMKYMLFRCNRYIQLVRSGFYRRRLISELKQS